jgi:ketosteroid isomerase-like protein
MSEHDLEVIRRTMEGVNAGTLDPGSYDPEVEFTTMPTGPMQSTYRGFAGVQAALANLQEVWEKITVEERELFETGGAIVAVFVFRLRGRGSGVELEDEEAWTYRMRNGRIWKIGQYASKAEALEALAAEGRD